MSLMLYSVQQQERGSSISLQNLVAQEYTLEKTSLLQQVQIFWQGYALVPQSLARHLLSRNMLCYSLVHNHPLSAAE